MEIDFLKGAGIDDVLDVRTRTVELRGARVILDQEVRRGEETLIRAQVTAAVINAEGRPRRLPKQIAARLMGE